MYFLSIQSFIKVAIIFSLLNSDTLISFALSGSKTDETKAQNPPQKKLIQAFFFYVFSFFAPK